MKEEIIKRCNNSCDIVTRTITKSNLKIDIIFCETLSNSSIIEDNIIKPLIINENFLITSPTLKEININNAYNLLFQGFTIIIINNNKIYSIESKINLDRSISESSIEGSITGPKDSFVENFNTNVGLIRKRIRNKDLCLESLNLGHLSNTKIGIMYVCSLIDKNLLKKVKERLKRIENDIINDGGYIKEKLSSKKMFPEINQTERPDLVSYSLLEGKICIIVDNSPTVLIIPTFFIDFFHTADDYYQDNINTSFTRILRFIAFFIAIFLPSIYICLITHNKSVLTDNILNMFTSNNSISSFSLFFEIIILTLSFEILRESEIRIPNKVSGSASILGALILGDAAVQAGIISPIMLLIVALSSISGFVFSYNSIVNIIRYYRMFILILSTFFGLLGLYIGLFILISNISSTTSFGYSYTYPFDPLIKSDLKDTFIKMDTNNRNPLLTKKRKR